MILPTPLREWLSPPRHFQYRDALENVNHYPDAVACGVRVGVLVKVGAVVGLGWVFGGLIVGAALGAASVGMAVLSVGTIVKTGRAVGTVNSL